MIVRDVIVQLLSENMSDELYFRYEDDNGNIRYFQTDGVCRKYLLTFYPYCSTMFYIN
jgi:hypothetical protein